MMRIITVRHPHAWAIIHGGKNVENRVRNIAGDYRGPVAIHVGLTWDGTSFDKPEVVAAHMRRRDEVDGLSLPDRETYEMDPQRGHIIGVVDLVGAHVCKSHSGNSDVPVCFKDGVPYAMTCSPWAQFTRGKRTHHIELTNPRPLATPIPYKGALGLRTLPEDVVAAIREQVK